MTGKTKAQSCAESSLLACTVIRWKQVHRADVKVITKGVKVTVLTLDGDCAVVGQASGAAISSCWVCAVRGAAVAAGAANHRRSGAVGPSGPRRTWEAAGSSCAAGTWGGRCGDSW
jgi:hypothetical protein